MAKIYKHEIPVNDKWHSIPMSGDVLHVGSQQTSKVHVWALHDDESDVMREFMVIGTGQEIPEGARYVGSTTDFGGFFVWHLVTRGA